MTARTVTALVIPTGDTPAYTTSLVGDLEHIQQIVGGYIEALGIGEDATMYLNEEGKMLGLPINGHANRLLAAAGVGLYFSDDHIVGPVVVFGTLDAQGHSDGYEHDVPDQVLQWCAQAGVPVAAHPHA